MANAQLAEEELQQSVVVSEEDTMEGDDATLPAPMAGKEQAEENDSQPSPNVQARHESSQGQSGKEAEFPALSLPPELQKERKGGLEDEVSIEGTNEEMEEVQREEEAEEEDADGEPDGRDCFGEDPYQEASASQLNEGIAGNGSGCGSSGFGAEGSDDEDEGVGAVKIQPGATDDEDEEGEEEPETANSLSPSDTEDSEVAAWEDAPEGGDDDEESEVAVPSVCIFCKQDEEHDPGEDFEEILECSTCGENAHRYCAREAKVLGREPNMSQWHCPDCVSQAGSQQTESADDPIQGENEEKAAALPASTRSSSQLSETALLDGANSPNTPTLPAAGEESVESSRLLRKRKTSTYTDVVDSTILRKRRRRTSKDGDWSLGSPQQAEQSQSIADQPRRLRLKTSSEDSGVTVIEKQHSLVVRFHVEPTSLRRIIAQQGIVSRKRASRTPLSRTLRTGVPSLAVPFLASATQPFYSFLDRETDEMKAKPYGGILTAAEADTSKTLPTNEDRRRFDEAKQKAEEEWRSIHTIEWNPEAPEKIKKYRKTNGPASQIECIEFGGWEIDTWYAAPYPEEYSRNRILYICEFCLKYMNSDYVSWRHKLKCPAKHPPGDEIYRHGSVSMFEVDGRKNPVYCQNLCLLAKLFLGSKTLYYDVEPFLFYVLCEYDELGYHFVGYFSKEKRASSQNNVSCILTLPIHQRKGYGNLLIDFSYLLTRVEQKTGSPEKPLSDMGLVSYRNYWRLVMCQFLLGSWKGSKESKVAAGLSIRQISEDTGLTPDDVVSALEGLRCLARDPVSGLYAFRVDFAYCQEYMSKWEDKEYVKLHPDALTWTPYVMGRGNATNFELGPAITAIAPREEDEDRKLTNGGGLNVHAKRNPRPGDPGSPHDSEDRMIVDDGQSGKLDGRCKNLQPGCNTTEPNDAGTHTAAADKGVYSDIFREDSHNLDVKSESWDTSYENVPVARFEVFPPPGGRRSDRSRPSVPRPTTLRTSSHNPRPKRSSGSSSVRRSATSRPSTGSSSRRKSGGTGRGPGRWPKGTKKSDYGNASSGPGLPPGWIRDREKMTTSKSSKANGTISADDAEASQEIKVQHLDSVSVTGADEGRATEATQYGNRNPTVLQANLPGSKEVQAAAGRGG